MHHRLRGLTGLVAIVVGVVFATGGCFLTGSGSGSGNAGGASASASIEVQAGYFFGHDLRQTTSIVYVLDLSGSMQSSSGNIVENAGTDAAAKAAGGLVGGVMGRGAGRVVKKKVMSLKKKIEKVKLHLIASLNGLPSTAQFNIILFDGSVQKLSPGFLQATGFTAATVSAFVARLEAGGSTNIYEAMETAIYEGPDHIVLLTDGLPTSSSPQQIIDMVGRHQGARPFRVSTVGVGADQAREFLSTLATANGGEYMFYD